MLLNWAQDLFDSKLHSDNFGCYSIDNLAHKLFYQYPVYNNPKVEKINTNGGLNAPQTFYKIVSDMPENKTENNTNSNKSKDNINKNNKELNKIDNNKELNDNSDQSIINDNSDINLIDYSEKSFAITGNTYPLKETLKEMNGKFNRFLTCGAGWIFSKNRLDEVKEKLNII